VGSILSGRGTYIVDPSINQRLRTSFNGHDVVVFHTTWLLEAGTSGSDDESGTRRHLRRGWRSRGRFWISELFGSPVAASPRWATTEPQQQSSGLGPVHSCHSVHLRSTNSPSDPSRGTAAAASFRRQALSASSERMPSQPSHQSSKARNVGCREGGTLSDLDSTTGHRSPLQNIPCIVLQSQSRKHYPRLTQAHHTLSKSYQSTQIPTQIPTSTQSPTLTTSSSITTVSLSIPSSVRSKLLDSRLTISILQLQRRQLLDLAILQPLRL
jgi:hypothetical protein